MGAFGIHPVLLDAALHAMGVAGGQAQTVLPFSWQGVCLHAAGASWARVRIAPVEWRRCRWIWRMGRVCRFCRCGSWWFVRSGDGVVVVAAAARGGGRLLEVAWSPVPLGARRAGDGVVVWEPGSGADGVVEFGVCGHP